jgi:hypothetical protein
VTGAPGHNAAREILRDWSVLRRGASQSTSYNLPPEPAP